MIPFQCYCIKLGIYEVNSCEEIEVFFFITGRALMWEMFHGYETFAFLPFFDNLTTLPFSKILQQELAHHSLEPRILSTCTNYSFHLEMSSWLKPGEKYYSLN